SRDYSPQYAGGPLFGKLLPGRRVRFTAERPGTTTAYQTEVLADTPLAYWRLGDTSGTTATDASGNGRHGTYQNSPTLNQTGALVGDANGSVLLNGSTQYVSVADVAAFGTAAVSAEGWVFLTAPVAGPSPVLNRRTSPGNVGGFTLELGGAGG